MTRDPTAQRVWLVIALVLALLAFIILPLEQPEGRSSFVAQLPPDVEAPTGALAEVYDLARPATLRIEVRSREQFFRSFVRGLGTGFFISPDGYILTAYHVVEGANEEGSLVGVGPNDDRYPLELVGFDAYLDLALLRTDVRGSVPFVPLADRAPRIGDRVVAIGNSRGDFLAARAGRVTALGVEASRADFASGTIELTAALAPGDSGGPVLNEASKVVGVVSYISFMGDGGLPGDNFIPPFLRGLGLGSGFASYAVPVELNSAVVAALQSGVRRDVPVIGFSWQLDYDPRNTDIDLGANAGPVVFRVQPGGPADRAGLRSLDERLVRNDLGQVVGRDVQADVILSVDGERTRSFNRLLAVVRSKEIGQRVTLEVQRGSETVRLELELGAKAQVFE
ncbi:MAG: S1C family serine protease [Trueperaceae bacterium]|nr:S1C family serine protease [Trueperaceae bacterium]